MPTRDPSGPERPRPRRRTLVAPVVLILAATLLATSCGTPTPDPAPLPPASVAPEEPDPLAGENVDRTDRTVLEALWDLEKTVRERDRRIATLEAELEAARRELAQLRASKTSSKP
jgi:hypothetical protein